MTRRSRIGRIEGFELDALRAHAVADIVAVAGAGRAAAALNWRAENSTDPVGAAEVVGAAVDVLDEEDVPLNVLSWKFLNSWRNSATLSVRPRRRIFAAEFEGVDDLRIELEVADQRLRAAPVAANGRIGDLSAERSRLKPPAL